MEIDGKKLTDKEQLFVEHFCSGEDMSYAEAARRAGYGKNSVREAYAIAAKPHIKAAIKAWRDNRARQFYISESKILDKLWQEANYYDQGATHAGRIQALVWLGKHLGMFTDKTKEQSTGKGNTYNIIQYNSDSSTTPTPKSIEAPEKIVETIEKNKEEVLEAIPEIDIEVENYS